MLDETKVAMVVAALVLVSPAPFLIAVGGAILARRRHGSVSRRVGVVVALTGGLALGALALFAINNLLALAILLGVPLLVVVSRLRAGRRVEAGAMIAGAALPWTLLWGFYVLAMDFRLADFDQGSTLGGFAIGALPLVIGVLVALRGDRSPGPGELAAATADPRSPNALPNAFRQGALIGPFGQPELAMLATFVVVSIVVPFLLPRDAPIWLRVLTLAIAAAVLGTEAYVRSMPTRTRLAFEAFSWLGEWELARARRAIGRIPISPDAATRWLDAHPEGPISNLDELPIRIEILTLAGRFDDGRRLAEQLPTPDAWSRFEQAALLDLVDWRAGGDGNVARMRALASEIEPADGDDRLHAEVTIAAGESRRRAASGASPDALAPLVEVRSLLGRRADGQVGRAYRRRLIPLLIVLGVVFGFVSELLGVGALLTR